MLSVIRTFIVDDEIFPSKLLQHLIEKHFPALKICGSAQDIMTASQFLNTNEVDLVFLDIELKGKSCFELLDKFRDRRFQFIVMSSSMEEAFKTFEYGGSGYLLKPINYNDLDSIIEQFFRRKVVIH